MVVIPKGSFCMGDLSGKGSGNKEPVHRVTFRQPFAVSQTEITFAQYDRCTRAGTCDKADDEGWGRGNRPVINVSWEDARRYAAWLRAKTGKPYRLLTEAEWEYTARAGSSSKYSWGDEIDCSRARYGHYEGECGNQQ
jgi:formylglycine-generating enzyme required for sulfatase activity